ncbi:MAG: hypothetical protein K8I30_06965, partial [Anaerolineae bacterium]|nr:hypothetical protein [Anaerolineae bacterium]
LQVSSVVEISAYVLREPIDGIAAIGPEKQDGTGKCSHPVSKRLDLRFVTGNKWLSPRPYLLLETGGW